MNGLWKKRIPAFLLTLVMIVSLMPAALAADCPDGNHQWDGGEITEEPTCINAGERTYKCTVSDCTAVKTEPAGTIDHAYKVDSANSKPATCKEEGLTVYVCSVCGNTKSDPVKKTSHSWNDWTVDEAATCAKTGKEIRTCSICLVSEEREIEKAKHSYNDDGIKVTKEPTCTASGTRTYTCKDCGDVKTETIEALGHTAPDANGLCIRCKTVVQHQHKLASKLAYDNNNHWNTCTTCSDKINVTAHTYNANNTCICGYTKVTNAYTVTFNTGSGATSVPAQQVQAGKSPVNVPSISRTGYLFLGWTASPNVSIYTGAQSYLTSAQIMSASYPINANTTYSAVYRVNASGQNASISATTNIGPYLLSQISSKCSAFAVAPYTIQLSPGNTYYGTLYTSSSQTSGTQISSSYSCAANQLSSMTFKAGSYSGNYTLGYTAKDSSGQNAVSGTITIVSAASTNKIEYTLAAGRSKSFSANDFRNLYRAVAGSSATLQNVVFSAPSNYSDYGAVVNGSRTFTRSNLSGYEFYYSNSKDGDYSLDSTSFKADNNAKSGTLSLDFIADGNYGEVRGVLEITISGTAKGDVTYNVKPDRQVTFDAEDFNDAFQKVYGSTKTDIIYVTFSAPSSYDDFRGQLQVGSKSFTRSALNDTSFYYDRSKYGEYNLDLLTFRADSNAKEGSTISIPFRAYYATGSNDYENCTLVINIGDGAVGTGDINYDVAPGKSVDFRAKDFRNYFEDNASGTFEYVEFDQPDSNAFNQGTLHHNYGTSSAKSFTRSNIDDFKFYYSPGTKDYGIGNLTFAATNNFKTTVTLDFTAYGTNGRSVNGTVSIASTESDDDGDITYTVVPGKSVDLQRTVFNTYFRKKYNSTISYVIFDRPGSTSIFNNGTLYCDYGTNNQTSFGRNDLSGTKFYYNKNDVGKNDYYLDELTFVAGTGFKDSIALDFTAYGERDDEYVEGVLVIKSSGSAAVTSSYTGSIRYATTTGTNVQINANDIARYFRQSYPTYNLQYVTLSGVPAVGSLYYNYYNASSYGTTSRAQITSSNYAGQTFYLSPSSTSQYALTELTYVPSGTSYCAGIPFVAYGTGGVSVTGSILISVSRAPVSEVYGVTPRNTAVNFPASSIYSAVLSATGSALSGIQLLSLPAATTGAVYIGTGADRADTRTMYTYAAGANQMSLLRFVPTASYTGSVEIPYVALDANGNALATGSFSLGVLNNRKTLKDVNSATWCYKYVMELTDQNVISGYADGSFKPNSTVTYGAALKLIMLAAGYPEQAPTGKNVFSGYLAKAQADGIVTRSNVNLSAPITRLQVAQIAAGAMKLSTSNLSSVKPFTDTSDVYVQALNAAGIVEGYFSNGTSTFKPSNTLNRGQMSAIVWRMNEYRK